jgi:hypothetical protein
MEITIGYRSEIKNVRIPVVRRLSYSGYNLWISKRQKMAKGVFLVVMEWSVRIIVIKWKVSLATPGVSDRSKGKILNYRQV